MQPKVKHRLAGVDAAQQKPALRQLRHDAVRLLRPLWPLVAATTALGGVSGLATAAVLAQVNAAIHAEGGLSENFLAIFFGLVVLGVGGTLLSSLGSTLADGRIRATLTRDLADMLLTTPIARLEELGQDRIMVSLNSDTQMVSNAIRLMSGLVVQTGIALGCFGYMLFLSPPLFALTVLILGLGIAAESILYRRSLTHFSAYFDLATAHLGFLRLLWAGAREMRINRARRMRLRDEQLVASIEAVRQNEWTIHTLGEFSRMSRKVALFTTLAAIIAYKALVGIDNMVLSGFILVLLYVEGPLGSIVGSLPEFGRAQIAYRRIADLVGKGDAVEPGLLAPVPRPGPTAPSPDDFATIDLRGVRYGFPSVGDKPAFSLGPIDLTIRQGEILFIVGENGSGKTTLIKMLLGLYPPTAGTLLRDGVPVTPETRDAYRQLFSVVFFDYTLFDDLVLPEGTGPEAGDGLLKTLDLTHKVAIRDSAFTTTDLSAGQRKRLALIQASLEGRPVLVLDEWAAEQDPTFRRLFYTQLLPDLKRAGRTLIVISHDDRYFGAADRVVHLENGVLREGAPVAVPA